MASDCTPSFAAAAASAGRGADGRPLRTTGDQGGSMQALVGRLPAHQLVRVGGVPVRRVAAVRQPSVCPPLKLSRPQPTFGNPRSRRSAARSRRCPAGRCECSSTWALTCVLDRRRPASARWVVTITGGSILQVQATSDGVTLKAYRAGTAVLHRCPDLAKPTSSVRIAGSLLERYERTYDMFV